MSYDDLDTIISLLFEIELKTAELYLCFHGRFISDFCNREIIPLSSAINIAVEIEDTFVEKLSIVHHIQSLQLKNTLFRLYGGSQRRRERLELLGGESPN
jgi:hypothetical protein